MLRLSSIALFLIIATIITSTRNLQTNPNLPCKVYNATLLDCSQRGLTTLPFLVFKNTLEKLYLSYNKLTEVTGKPFLNVSSLQYLYLSHNYLHHIENYVFAGLKILLELNLSHNNLVTLPKLIFQDLRSLKRLRLNDNSLKSIPNEAISPLSSLQSLLLFGNDLTSIHFGPEFLNLCNLQALFVSSYSTLNSTEFAFHNNSLQALASCPLQFFLFPIDHYPLTTAIFTNLTNIRELWVAFSFSYEELVSLSSPLESLHFNLNTSELSQLTLKPLVKWKATMTRLDMNGGHLKNIGGAAFSWLPLLREINLSANRITHLSTDAFHGLTLLEDLNLSQNLLSSLAGAFDFFTNVVSFKQLDLSYNILSLFPDTLNWLHLPHLQYLNLNGNDNIAMLNSSLFLPLKNLRDLSIHADFIMEDCPPLAKLKSFFLKTEFSFLKFEHTFSTPLCKVAPNLELATLQSIRSQTFADVIGQSCPYLQELHITQCHCTSIANDAMQPESNLPNLTSLYLTDNGFKSTSQIRFVKAPMLRILDLSNNEISAIDDNMINFLQNLTHLYMAGNKLTSMDNIINLKFLVTLDLARNHLKSVPLDFLNQTFNVSPTSQFTLDLSGNPFECTCAIKSFQKWIATDDKVLLNVDSHLDATYNCSQPHANVSVSSIALDCSSHLGFYIGFGIAVGITILTVSVFFIKYRWHVKYAFFLLTHRQNNWRFLDNNFSMDENANDSVVYDAYVAYNETSDYDEGWVLNDLRSRVEDGEGQLKLFIKGRDLIPSGPKADGIFEAIHKSRKTILVLTPQFVADEWCYFEMQTALMRLFHDSQDVLILILLEEIPDNLLTMSLRQLFCRKELIKWPNDRLGHELFWRRLEAEMRKPCHVDRHYDV